MHMFAKFIVGKVEEVMIQEHVQRWNTFVSRVPEKEENCSADCIKPIPLASEERDDDYFILMLR